MLNSFRSRGAVGAAAASSLLLGNTLSTRNESRNSDREHTNHQTPTQCTGFASNFSGFAPHAATSSMLGLQQSMRSRPAYCQSITHPWQTKEVRESVGLKEAAHTESAGGEALKRVTGFMSTLNLYYLLAPKPIKG
jgi:hypothetical protein